MTDREFGPGSGRGPGRGRGGRGRGGPRRGRNGIGRGDVRVAVLALLNEEPMHGYQIMSELAERSNGAWKPSPGSIYPLLQQLADEGLVESDEADGRKVFTITSAGTDVAAETADQPPVWERMAKTGGVDLREAVESIGAAARQVAMTGTPEQVKATLGAGQLARRLGLPWRCAAGSAANINDVQAAHETELSGWGCLMAGSTLMIHSAGWLESGLTVSYEKLITDMEMVQSMAELCQDTPAGEDEIGFEALCEVDPGGHFFATAQTMDRYQTAFYEPLVADFTNFGTWSERGSVDAKTRATGIWQNILAQFTPPETSGDRLAALRDFIDRRTAAGGAPPES